MCLQQMRITGIIAAIALLAFFMLRAWLSQRKLREHQKACEVPGYRPQNTFTGTMRHLEGLPVPVNLKLGVAANADWGIAFAKKRFRYAVQKTEIERAEADGRFLTIWVRQAGSPKAVRLKGRSARFPRRVMDALLCPDVITDGFKMPHSGYK